MLKKVMRIASGDLLPFNSHHCPYVAWSDAGPKFGSLEPYVQCRWNAYGYHPCPRRYTVARVCAVRVYRRWPNQEADDAATSD